MKSSKKILSIVVIITMLMAFSISLFTNGSYAAKYAEPKKGLLVYSASPYEFVASELEAVYADNSALEEGAEPFVLKYRMDVTGKEAIKLGSFWGDGKIDGRDGSGILRISKGYGAENSEEITVAEANSENVRTVLREFISALSTAKNIDEKDINVKVQVLTPAITGYRETAQGYLIDADLGLSQGIITEIKETEALNERIAQAEGIRDAYTQQKVSVTVITKTGEEWKMVLATDNNFYLVKTETEPVAEFKTTLEYVQNDKTTKDDGKTFYPEYKENDIDKKDLDVQVIIRSKTEEGIKSTNEVELTNDGKPNSEGWFYKNVEDRTVIAKDYPFDKYDNTTANGMVKETVKLLGDDDGRDEQTPDIKWTFRRKSLKETENEDKSVTETITYNLPVDEESIPTDDGWKPVYDKDGKTIHVIERIIKQGEDYEKDVTVKQNGTDAKVTTPVKKVWPKEEPDYSGKKQDEDKKEADDLGPQAGAFTATIVMIIIGLSVFAYTRYRKLNK